MTTGWRYRIASVVGTALLAGLAIAIVNEPVVQNAFAVVPYFGRPAPVVLANGDLLLAITTAVVVMLAAMWQLFKPQPRRILDTILETQRRVLLAMVGLAALGYFNYSYRLPRSTVMLATLLLLGTLPLYMVVIRRRPQSVNRALLVGDDTTTMRAILSSNGLPILGFVAPPGIEDVDVLYPPDTELPADTERRNVERIGGLSRIEEVILARDVDTVLLAFDSTDRAEFFGTLTTCHAHGIDAKVHRDHADNVLVAPSPEGELVDIDLEPWDLQERIVKRLFDVSFASIALFVLSPIIALIALAITLDDRGPVLYSQERTAEFGNRFTVYKFRTMRPGGEDATPGDEFGRVTRIGKFLRRTHLDEIPQLWSILTGQMSVVGPRAVWTDEETHLENATSTWRKRWFVKPGLTGLAQINDADSTKPAAKLRYDLEYIRDQSFWLDSRIVLRQLWRVGADIHSCFGSDVESPSRSQRDSNGSRQGAEPHRRSQTAEPNGSGQKTEPNGRRQRTESDSTETTDRSSANSAPSGDETLVTDGSSEFETDR